MTGSTESVFTVTTGSRTLGVRTAGDPAGTAVFVLRGSGSSRIFTRDADVASTLQFRLLGYDRPGYAKSTRSPGRRMCDAAEDMSAVAAHLGIHQFAVIGSSGAAGYAVAAAALLPDKVTAVALLGPVAPFNADGLDFFVGMADGLREQFELCVTDPAKAEESFRDLSRISDAYFSKSENWLEYWGHAALCDPAHDQAWADFLAASCRDAITQGHVGAWDDRMSLMGEWGIDFCAISNPVRIWHGLADRHVSHHHARWFADRMKGTLTLHPNDNHTNVEENRRAEVFAWLRETIARPNPAQRGAIGAPTLIKSEVL